MATVTNALNPPSRAWRVGRRVVRWIGRGLAALIGLIAVLALGNRPLIVLAAGQNMTATPYWAEAQRRQAALSTHGRLIVAAGSGHAIHWEQPALVVDAVRQVIADVRSR